MQNRLSSSLLSENIKSKIYRMFVLRVMLYGCETWSFTMRQEHKLRVFKNRMLRNISRPKRDEVTEEWRRLHKEKLCDLYYSPNIQGDKQEK